MNHRLNKKVYCQQLGLIDYQEAWDYQELLFAEIVQAKIANRKRPAHEQQPTNNYLLCCEHPPVYTLGKSGHAEHLLLDVQALADKHIQYYKINRGGDITFHGPGQVVVYPILDLENFFTDIHKYLRSLEETVIRTLAEYGVEAGRIAGLTGVWIDPVWTDHQQQLRPRKICAMGVKSSRWVTMHGLALNVNTDLRYFDHIVPCGIKDKAVTSLEKELQTPQDMQEVTHKLRKHLSDLFHMELVLESKLAVT